MKYRIITIGKIKNKNLFEEINDLIKKIDRIEIIELKEIKEKNEELLKEKELKEFEKYLKLNNNYNIILTEQGKEFTTENFYKKIKEIENKNIEIIQFFIFGPFGPSKNINKYKIDLDLSLSKMTFTHKQALYLLIEQIYRVECFKKNIPYTK
jgi:23S rRNA (pseudouridine1915-N3)-methyltransferase